MKVPNSQPNDLYPSVDVGSEVEPERRWVEAFADHVRRRFGSRALVAARIADQPPRQLRYIYALPGGGLVLTCPSHDPNERPHDAHNTNDGPHAGDAHGHGGHGDSRGSEPDTGCCEVWLASPDQAVFEARPVDDGEWCTGFGYLGLSRTPHVFVPRGTEPPPTRDPHAHDNF